MTQDGGSILDPERSVNRIVDASLNRAAEGLRVAEDVCRFHWNLPGLARELKELRHELLDAGRGEVRAVRDQLAARDIEGDVGRASGVAGAAGRSPPAGPAGVLPEAARSNLQRAREAIRTLEEVTRHRDPRCAARFEAVRYRLYGLEKALAGLAPERDRAEDLARVRLCLVASERLCRGPLEEAVEAALEAGADMIQMREKSMDDVDLLRRGRRLREITARRGALFIVNDRADIAVLVEADGVHLGQGDLPPAEARAIVGETKLIGRSTHSLEEARRASREGADYIGAGPAFATRTKETGPPLGPEEIGRISAEIPLPVLAIGGIDERSLPLLVAAGARRAAVSAVILASDDVGAAVRTLLRILDGGAESRRAAPAPPENQREP
ncbi:MAG: thiamine phosphate synthase [Planctomycetes bacterium]|nr:thiamine phosphate synthase [Planctomycetota bacterium]